jgi:nicotinamidase-related amidase
MTLNLPVTFYRGAPAADPVGRVTETWSLDLARTALIELHCWNIGWPDGVPVPLDHWVFMGSLQNHEPMVAVVQDVIAPLLEAGRQAGMAVVHVQSESIAARYPAMGPTPAGEHPPTPAGHPGGLPPATDDALRRTERVHGEGYRQWAGWEDLDVASPVRPRPGDTVIATTEGFDRWLRERGITTLLYTGFATNLCILDSPAAMKAMRDRGYRCVILREATLAVEFPDTLEARVHTRASLQYIEAWVGYSASAFELLPALRGLAPGR